MKDSPIPEDELERISALKREFSTADCDILESLAKWVENERKIESLCSSRKELMVEDDKWFTISLSIGASSCERFDEKIFQQLLGFADKAVYQAKAGGKGCATFISVEPA